MILYAVIARTRDGAILVESIIAGLEGNFPQITVEVLAHVAKTSDHASVLGTSESTPPVELLPNGGRRTFVQRHDGAMSDGLFSGAAKQWTAFFDNDNDDVESFGGGGGGADLDYYFHMCRKDNVICLCISDDTDVRYHAVNYDFLDDAQATFGKSYASYKVTKAKAYEMDKKFKRELGKLMHFYNENRNKMARQDKMDGLISSVDDLKEVFGRNAIAMLLQREVHLNALVDKSDDMMDDIKVFSRRSVKLRTKTKRNYNKYYLIVFIFGALVLYLFLGEICGYSLKKCSASSDEGT